MKVIYEKSEGMNVPIKVWGDVDDNTIEQTKNVTRLPFIHKWVSLAPDNHYGYGVPIGSIVPCNGYILPYAVGSDIGCGMSAIPLGIDASDIHPDDIKRLFEMLQKFIPVGYARHQDDDVGSVRYENSNYIRDLIYDTNLHGDLFNSMKNGIFSSIVEQMGTLGNGNHFFELQKDANNKLWFMVHSGSRNLGAKICDLHMGIAKDMCSKYHSNLSDPWLAYLPVDSQEGQNYIEQMNVALKYAYLNREEMIRQGVGAVKDLFGVNVDMDNLINIHHNYAAIENHFGKNVWVHRKGATSAREGQIGIIPGSMCTKSYIVRGKGNKDSFMSCSHGSGRNFSRTESKRRIADGTDASVSDQLGDVMVFGTNDVSDEVGSSYKNVEDVMAYQSDLVDIVEELTPIAVLKG